MVGFIDYVFVLMYLLGFCFVLCICDFGEIKLYVLNSVQDYLILCLMVGGILNIKYVCVYWDDILCFVSLIKQGIVIVLLML